MPTIPPLSGPVSAHLRVWTDGTAPFPIRGLRRLKNGIRLRGNLAGSVRTPLNVSVHVTVTV